MTVISSEKLKTMPRFEWNSLDQGDIINLNLKTRKFIIHKKKKTIVEKFREYMRFRERYVYITSIINPSTEEAQDAN